MSKVEGYLEQLGLSPLETKVYLGLLEKGPTTILELSKRIKTNRSTTHITVESLIKKGLATHIQNGSKRNILPEPPEKLAVLIEQEKCEVKRREDTLPVVISSIYDLISSAKESSDSSVKYYEGIRSISALYSEILNSKEIRTYANATEIQDIFPENTSKFIEAVKKGNYLWDLMMDTPNARNFISSCKYPTYFHKFFPKNLRMNSMDYLIYGDSIAIIQSRPHLFAVVIKNKFLYENAVMMYDLLWNLLPTQL